MGAEKSDRIVFGIPRHDMVVVGTTDTDFPGSPDEVVATAEDVNYLLDITAQYFPGARITREDIIASYAGVRPLVKDESSSEGKTSREHTIFNDPRGVTFVAGGKYTTYRLMAKQVVEKALDSFSTEDQVRFKATDTAVPLNEFTSPEAYRQSLLSVQELSEASGRRASEVRSLCERYGRETEKILASYDSQWTLWQIEAAHAIDATMCLHLVDFYTRRVPLFLADPVHGLTVMDEVARVFQLKLRWTDAQTEEEKAVFRRHIEKELAWKTRKF
jgi:glycerol-3-phosphate dehydrogenase